MGDNRVPMFRITVSNAQYERVGQHLVRLIRENVVDSFTQVPENGRLQSYVIYLHEPMLFNQIIALVSQFLPENGELGVN